MPWEDRLQQAAYESPGGTRLPFIFEDVSVVIEKKTSSFNFADADGTYVQDNGVTSRQFPLRLFFSGDDYDQEAEAFFSLLKETGVGKLEHPAYGTVNVVPFGPITRNDRLKTATNQAVFDVVFWETLLDIYPLSQNDPASDVRAAVAEFNNASAGQLQESLSLGTAGERVSFKNTFQALLDSADAGLSSVADTQDDVRQQFETVKRSINSGIDTLISDPLTLAFQTAILIQTPARALADIEARLSAYKSLAETITTSANATVSPSANSSRAANTFRARELFATTYVTGSILSVVNTQFETKTGALQAAIEILEQFSAVNEWREANYAALDDAGATDEVDTGGAYQQLQEATALTAGLLVAISFTLRQERRVILDRDRTVIDLASEVYGEVDDQLDFLINSNNLTGSEILTLPRGREIVYYV